jgi:hypothetical protein
MNVVGTTALACTVTTLTTGRRDDVRLEEVRIGQGDQ